MDYPKSVPSVGLVNGRFVDENPVAGTPGSLIPAVWGNAVTQEILSVVAGAGMAPLEADTGQLLKAIQAIIGVSSPMRPVVTRLAASKLLAPEELGLVLIDANPGATTVTLPVANTGLGIRDVIVRRVDNTANRLVVRCSDTDSIKFHTHLRAGGYPFLVLMGAGDWWHLRSDASGNWWPVGRYDGTTLGRVVFETSSTVMPGGYGVLNGYLFNRTEWPWVWDHAQASGMLTTEALRAGKEGMWTSGDGATTFRSPEARGEFVRVLDELRAVDASRAAGSWQAGQIESHNHSTPGAGSFGTQMMGGGSNNYSLWQAGATGFSGGSETRPRNIAFPGRIKLI
ncbi:MULTISPECIES: phage tail protein [unclassified Pseudomonas]|jgi:hypothetical protein|uniref:phage tail protein n=1 Tax=unclassified Pseudomonas TaxID=196821 RepID=UPI00177FBB3E|nr:MULTISPECIES: phage tail protein [unclassified Pseudomonas]MBD9598530.1 phage tail protein [Pseudomonas sp. PDM10]MBV7511007.1 phage tail protein [Pseudomonas sp. PDM25]